MALVLPGGRLVNYWTRAAPYQQWLRGHRLQMWEVQPVFSGKANLPNSFENPVDAWFSASCAYNWPGQCMPVYISHHMMLYFSGKGYTV